MENSDPERGALCRLMNSDPWKRMRTHELLEFRRYERGATDPLRASTRITTFQLACYWWGGAMIPARAVAAAPQLSLQLVVDHVRTER